mmetsp:Transcript_14502/g.46303  ORF Transcript_14502/g.46303 Transcript_14502/m.46303 type:complete len:85 (+) Transcript_14502:582-836(+)
MRKLTIIWDALQTVVFSEEEEAARRTLCPRIVIFFVQPSILLSPMQALQSGVQICCLKGEVWPGTWKLALGFTSRPLPLDAPQQ